MDPFPHGDRRLPHRFYPPKYLELGELHRLSNIAYFKVHSFTSLALKIHLRLIWMI
jgi:hypothetical protein